MDKYNFEYYEKILDLIKKGDYETFTCQQSMQQRTKKKTVIIRHDVDYFPERALAMAQIEASKNIVATYFFRVHCNEYNVLSYKVMNIIKRIAELGHEIGIHAEPVDLKFATGISEENSLKLDQQVLNFILAKKEDHKLGIASHREATGLNNLSEYLNTIDVRTLGFLYEAYDDYALDLFENSTYITDSNEWYWKTYEQGDLTGKVLTPIDVLTRGDKTIYMLIHPNLWYRHHLHLGVD